MEQQSSLIKEIQRLNELITKLNKKQGFFRVFVNGVLYGFGSLLGGTIVVAIVFQLLKNVPTVPLVGDWFAEVIRYSMTKIAL